MDKSFKFRLEDVVAVKGDRSMEGTITIRMNVASGNRYEFRLADGSSVIRDERDLVLAEHRPSWLKKGAKIRWLGEGRHDVYVVTRVNRRWRGMPAGISPTFNAERDLKDKLGNPAGKEVVSSSWSAKDIMYWERYREPRRKSRAAST